MAKKQRVNWGWGWHLQKIRDFLWYFQESILPHVQPCVAYWMSDAISTPRYEIQANSEGYWQSIEYFFCECCGNVWTPYLRTWFFLLISLMFWFFLFWYFSSLPLWFSMFSCFDPKYEFLPGAVMQTFFLYNELSCSEFLSFPFSSLIPNLCSYLVERSHAGHVDPINVNVDAHLRKVTSYHLLKSYTSSPPSPS